MIFHFPLQNYVFNICMIYIYIYHIYTLQYMNIVYIYTDIK